MAARIQGYISDAELSELASLQHAGGESFRLRIGDASAVSNGWTVEVRG